jgi:hypothetical protein
MFLSNHTCSLSKIKLAATLLLGLTFMSYAQDDWTPRSGKIGYGDVFSVKWDGTKFNIPANTGIIQSENGTCWSESPKKIRGYTIKKIVNNADVYVALAESLCVVDPYSGHSYFMQAILVSANDDSCWHVVGRYGVRTYIADIFWCNDQFIAPYSYINDLHWYRGEMLTSVDGTTWQQRRPACSEYYLRSVIYSDGQYVGVGLNGRIIVSTDAINWKDRSPIGAGDLYHVVHGESGYVALGTNGVVFSSDGLTWSKTGFDSFTADRSGITYGNGKYVIVSEEGNVFSSEDGMAWHRQCTGIIDNLHGIAYGNDMFVVVGSKGTIMTSPASSVSYEEPMAEPATSVSPIRVIAGNRSMNISTGFSGSVFSLNGRLLHTQTNSSRNAIRGLAHGKYFYFE